MIEIKPRTASEDSVSYGNNKQKLCQIFKQLGMRFMFNLYDTRLLFVTKMKPVWILSGELTSEF